ncbi:MAG TPA: hypothetical protein VKM93_05235 [Terriglobia bacterium]|nr:hypothetical protein [Terriglobia bacterium]
MSKPANLTRHDAQTPPAAAPDPDYAAALAAARPKVKELLAEYRDDPNGDAGAIVETLMLNQVAGEPAREADMLVLHHERDLYQTLKHDSGRSATRLARQNRRLKGEFAKRIDAQDQVRQYLEEVGTAARSGKKLSAQEVYDKISAVIGIGDVVIPRVETGPVADAWNSRGTGNRVETKPETRK